MVEAVEEWLSSAPYASAFVVTSLKATAADVMTQCRELREATRRGELPGMQPVTPSDSARAADEALLRKEHLDVVRDIRWQRALAFFLYGGLYQGCVQYYLFNECYPLWFGDGTDWHTILTKVAFDQLVLTPFLCLPVCYLVQAAVLRHSLGEGLRRYTADARRDLLLKYWLVWGPVQAVTFGVVPEIYRVPFIALVSFFWTLVLSTISNRDAADAADAAPGAWLSSPPSTLARVSHTSH